MWKTAFKTFEVIWSTSSNHITSKNFKGCLPQVLLGSFLNTLSLIKLWQYFKVKMQLSFLLPRMPVWVLILSKTLYIVSYVGADAALSRFLFILIWLRLLLPIILVQQKFCNHKFCREWQGYIWDKQVWPDDFFWNYICL